MAARKAPQVKRQRHDSPEENRRDKVLSVRVSDEARDALDAVAARWGLSRSAAVARLALEAAAKG